MTIELNLSFSKAKWQLWYLTFQLDYNFGEPPQIFQYSYSIPAKSKTEYTKGKPFRIFKFCLYNSFFNIARRIILKMLWQPCQETNITLIYSNARQQHALSYENIKNKLWKKSWNFLKLKNASLAKESAICHGTWWKSNIKIKLNYGRRST